MEEITIQIGAKWVNIARAPLYYLVAALQSVAVAFVPFILCEFGKGGIFCHRYEGLAVLACFAAIFLVPLFCYRLRSPPTQS